MKIFICMVLFYLSFVFFVYSVGQAIENYKIQKEVKAQVSTLSRFNKKVKSGELTDVYEWKPVFKPFSLVPLENKGFKSSWMKTESEEE